jgi:hypothetical protein
VSGLRVELPAEVVDALVEGRSLGLGVSGAGLDNAPREAAVAMLVPPAGAVR